MGKTAMLRQFLASSMAMGFVAGCGAAGDDGQNGVTVRPDESASMGGGAPAPSTGDPGAPMTGATGPDFNVSDDVANGVTPMGCQQAERSFVPNIPTVYLLVDRSGTMFEDVDPGPDNVNAWTALRGGVLQVMQELQANVSLGFAAFSGANPSMAAGACDLELPSVPPKLNNYADIAAVYEPLERPTNPSQIETPTLLAMAEIVKQLQADTTAGDKYILFVTDGEPDYCNNGNQLCPPDSVVGLLQRLASGVDANGAPTTPIRTLVFGISSPAATIRADVLQAFANAGAGLPVMAISQNPGQVPSPNDIWDQCNGLPGWANEFALTGKPLERGQSTGDYVFDPTLAGNAPVFRPDPTDQAALTEQLRAALASVKSCTFDLGEDGVQVDLNRPDLGDKARVVVNGTAVPFDPVNGWSMMSETTVALSGAACEMWRDPLIATSINFDFPCDIFVPR